MSTLLLILWRNLLRTYLTVISVVISSNAVAFVATCSQLYALTLNHTLLAVWIKIKSNTFFNIFGHIFLWSFLSFLAYLDYKDFLHKDPSGGQTLQTKFSLIKSIFIKKFNLNFERFQARSKYFLTEPELLTIPDINKVDWHSCVDLNWKRLGNMFYCIEVVFTFPLFPTFHIPCRRHILVFPCCSQ